MPKSSPTAPLQAPTPSKRAFSLFANIACRVRRRNKSSKSARTSGGYNLPKFLGKQDAFSLFVDNLEAIEAYLL